MLYLPPVASATKPPLPAASLPCFISGRVLEWDGFASTRRTRWCPRFWSSGLTGGDSTLARTPPLGDLTSGSKPWAGHLSATPRSSRCTGPGAPSQSRPILNFDLKKIISKKWFKACLIHNLSSRAPKIVKQILTYSINQDLQFGTIACYV